MKATKNKNLIFPEQSYEIVGALFEVFHELGAGLKERHYYPAIKEALIKRGMDIKEQLHVPVQFQQNKIGTQFLDFLIDDKIVLELKVDTRFRKPDYDQIKAYLATSNCSLGILARFDADGVTFHRVLNPNN